MTEEAPPHIISQTFDPEISMRRLKEHPDNPRKGDDGAVGDSIDAHGFYGAVLIHKKTRHVLAGNTRYRVMKSKKAKTIPGFWVDCDEATAKRIMLVDNRTSDMATYDDDLLLHLLRDQPTLTGTGYDDGDLAALLLAQESATDFDPSSRDSLDDTEDAGSGDLLNLAEVTLGEPVTPVESGDVFILSGHHVLIHCDLMTGWRKWAPLLEQHASDDTVFLPYPGPYVAAADVDRVFVMVQPNRYLAAHVLDKWQSVHGAGSVVKQ